MRYQRLIYAIPRRAGLSEDQTADVFQTVFARLVEHLDRIEQPSRVRAWLVTTARRETWRVARRESSAQSLGAYDDAESQAGHQQLSDGARFPEQVVLRLEEQH